VPIGEKLLIDSGVVNNTPIGHAVELGAERIYVLPTSDPSRRSPHSPRTALDAAIYALSLLVGRRLEADIVRYGQDVELVVLPAANTRNVQPTDFDHSSRLMSEALTATRDMLARAVPERRPLQAA
jgi:NTE family protein